MSKNNVIHKRSDGAYETPDGMFAVKVRVISGVEDDMNWFEYKASVMAPVTRIEWRSDSPFALLPQAEAKFLVRAGYAVSITDKEMDNYNRAIARGMPVAPSVEPVREKITPKQFGDPPPPWLKDVEPEPAIAETLAQVQPEKPTKLPVPESTTPPEPISPMIKPPPGVETLIPIQPPASPEPPVNPLKPIEPPPTPIAPTQ